MASKKQPDLGSVRPTRPRGWMLSRFQVVLTLCAMAVSLALVFGLGFLLGLWYQANEQIMPPSDAVALAEEQLKQKPAPASAKEMTFYSTLTEREATPAPPVAPETTVEETAAVEKPPPLPRKNPAADRPLAPVADRLEKRPPPATPVAAVAPVPSSSTFYSVQVGSFREAKSAQRLQQQLEQKGYAARTHRVTVPGQGPWYRVRVGRFAQRAEADRMAQRLHTRESIPVLVMSESP